MIGGDRNPRRDAPASRRPGTGYAEWGDPAGRPLLEFRGLPSSRLGDAIDPAFLTANALQLDRFWLLVRLEPAQAHTGRGTLTAGERQGAPGLPALAGSS